METPQAPVTVEVKLPPQEQLENTRLQAQAYEINSKVFKDENPLPDMQKAQESGSVILYLVEGWKTSRLNNKMAQLDHASRYFKGQPHDDHLALSGIDVTINMAEKRAGRIKNEPDDATAALNDLPFLEAAYNKLATNLGVI